jgi:hypothetical protein
MDKNRFMAIIVMWRVGGGDQIGTTGILTETVGRVQGLLTVDEESATRCWAYSF